MQPPSQAGPPSRGGSCGLRRTVTKAEGGLGAPSSLSPGIVLGQPLPGRFLQARQVSDIHLSTPLAHRTPPHPWYQLNHPASCWNWRVGSFTLHLYSCVIPEAMGVPKLSSRCRAGAQSPPEVKFGHSANRQMPRTAQAHCPKRRPAPPSACRRGSPAPRSKSEACPLTFPPQVLVPPQ